MKYTLLIAMTVLAGCGSSNPNEDPTIDNPANQPVSETNPGAADASADVSASTNMPGNDPIANRTYTNTYGNNFCDSSVSDLQCWGDVDFHAGAPVQKLLMGRDAICYATTGFSNGVDCYSASLGPITMDAHAVSGYQNSSVQTFTNVIVNTQGQICFKVTEWHGSTIHAIYNVCGFAPTAQGGIQ